MKNFLLIAPHLALCLFLINDHGPAQAAPRLAPFPGLREPEQTTHAITGAKIVVSPNRTIDNGTIVFRDGVIVAVGDKVIPPADAQVHDCKGKTLYAGFLDAYSELPADASRAVANDKSGAGYWNQNIVPQVSAAAIYAADADANRKYRSQGVAVRLVAPAAGIVKGTSALVTTADDGGRETILKEQVCAAREAHHGARRRRIPELADGRRGPRAPGVLRCRLVRPSLGSIRRQQGPAAPRTQRRPGRAARLLGRQAPGGDRRRR